MKTLIVTVIVLLSAALTTGANAVTTREQDVDWHSVAGSGGASSGGDYQLLGAAGQSDAGYLRGGEFELSGGFWDARNVTRAVPAFSVWAIMLIIMALSFHLVRTSKPKAAR